MAGLVLDVKHQKGREGEKYVAAKVAELEYRVLYVGGSQLYTITGDKYYVVDLMAFKLGKCYWIQVKHKEPREFYPDTGMELFRYRRLCDLQKESGLAILVLFTDNSKRIYGEWLDNLPRCVSDLGNNYNRQTNTEMVYWLMEKLKDYRELL